MLLISLWNGSNQKRIPLVVTTKLPSVPVFLFLLPFLLLQWMNDSCYSLRPSPPPVSCIISPFYHSKPLPLQCNSFLALSLSLSAKFLRSALLPSVKILFPKLTENTNMQGQQWLILFQVLSILWFHFIQSINTCSSSFFKLIFTWLQYHLGYLPIS